jgi:hypothetical protein
MLNVFCIVAIYFFYYRNYFLIYTTVLFLLVFIFIKLGKQNQCKNLLLKKQAIVICIRIHNASPYCIRIHAFFKGVVYIQGDFVCVA